LLTRIGMGVRDGFAMRGVIYILTPLQATDIPTGFSSKGGIRWFRAKPIKAMFFRKKH
jgi:hypothetical protein